MLIRDIITILLNRILRYDNGYALFEIKTLKVKLYYFLMRLNLLRILNHWKLHKKYQKWVQKHPLESKELLNDLTNQIDHFLAYGRLQ